jgi:hypothetical protein
MCRCIGVGHSVSLWNSSFVSSPSFLRSPALLSVSSPSPHLHGSCFCNTPQPTHVKACCVQAADRLDAAAEAAITARARESELEEEVAELRKAVAAHQRDANVCNRGGRVCVCVKGSGG